MFVLTSAFSECSVLFVRAVPSTKCSIEVVFPGVLENKGKREKNKSLWPFGVRPKILKVLKEHEVNLR